MTKEQIINNYKNEIRSCILKSLSDINDTSYARDISCKLYELKNAIDKMARKGADLDTYLNQKDIYEGSE